MWNRAFIGIGGVFFLGVSVFGFAEWMRAPMLLFGFLCLVDLMFMYLSHEEEAFGVYIPPRIPYKGTVVELRGAPGGKVIYWPSGGNGLGGSNDRICSKDTSPKFIREHASGCGVVILDERGRGNALVMDDECEHLLYREVRGSGTGGPIGRVIVNGRRLIAGGRSEKTASNTMGGMRPAGVW